MQFASGRPYAAVIAPACPTNDFGAACGEGDGNIVNNTAAIQSTANSALGINGAGAKPGRGVELFLWAVDAAG
jgi:hypothetical protein